MNRYIVFRATVQLVGGVATSPSSVTSNLLTLLVIPGGFAATSSLRIVPVPRLRLADQLVLLLETLK